MGLCNFGALKSWYILGVTCFLLSFWVAYLYPVSLVIFISIDCQMYLPEHPLWIGDHNILSLGFHIGGCKKDSFPKKVPCSSFDMKSIFILVIQEGIFPWKLTCTLGDWSKKVIVTITHIFTYEMKTRIWKIPLPTICLDDHLYIFIGVCSSHIHI